MDENSISESNKAINNANELHQELLNPLERVALKITNVVGSMGFFLIIFCWTVLWCGYNILASTIPALHWHAFDPFPAFVAYLLMSNVIQILLMPLIMVGQNLQGRHSEIRAELDFQINKKSEAEVESLLRRLEYNTNLIIQLMEHLECRISAEELRAISKERELSKQIMEAKNIDPNA